LPADVLAALQRGSSIEAIKLLRESTGLGLKEAKDIIDQHLKGNPAPLPVAADQASLSSAVAAALESGNKIEAIRRLRKETGLGLKQSKELIESFKNERNPQSAGLSPGEVRKSSGSLWFAVGLAALAVIVYYFA
jgi:ribosomal protein L7/L12